MKENNINKLIEEFDWQSNKVKNCLIDLLNVIDNGCVPSHEKMIDLETRVTDLSKKYDEVYTLVENSISGSELPAPGSPVGQLSDAFRNSAIRRMESQINSVKGILQRFISIRSAIDYLTEALTPYQKKSEHILQQLNKDTVEKLLPETEAPELFLQAMEFENIYSSEGIELMQQVTKYYPDIRILLGLTGKKYYYDNTSEVIAFSNAEVDDVLNKKEPSNNTDVLIDDNDVKLIVSNKVKIAAPSASSFKKEIIKISRMAKEITTILPLFTNLGVLTKTQMYYFGICVNCFDENNETKERVFSAVDLLAEKGYIAEFSFPFRDGDDRAYCLSSYCYKCMHKDSIAQQSIWSVTYGAVKITADTEIKSTTVYNTVINNNILMNCMISQKGLLSDENYEKVKRSVKWKNDHYQVAVIDNGKVCISYLAAPYMDIDSIKEEYILISADLSENIPDSFSSSCIRIFVLKDNKLCSCDPGKNILSQIDEAFDPDADKEGLGPAEPDLSGTRPEIAETIYDNDLDPVISETAEGAEHIATEISEELAVLNNSAVAVAEKTRSVSEEKAVDTPEKVLNTYDGSLTIEELSAYGLLELDRTPYDDEFCAFIHSLLNKKVSDDKELRSVIVQSVLFAKGAGLEPDCTQSKQLSSQVRLATNLLLDDCSYSSECLSTAFANMEDEIPALTIAAYMYAMLTPAAAYDYDLNTQTEIYFSKFEEYFGELSAFKPLFDKLMMVHDVKAGGFTPAVVALLGNEVEKERFINDIRNQARGYLVVNPPKTRMKALPVMYGAEFGSGSDLYQCMEIISSGKNDAESLELVEVILSDYCDNANGLFSINESKMEVKLNKAWDTANPKNKFKLEFDAKDQALRQYRLRLKVMLAWEEHIRNQTGDHQDLARLKSLKKDIIDLLGKIREDNQSWINVKDANVLFWLISYMTDYLNDKSSNIVIYSDLLYTGVFSLSEDGSPEIDALLPEIKYYELWRNVLRHIITEPKTIGEITSEILGGSIDSDAGLKDNLRQLEMIGKLIGSDDDIFSVNETQKKEARDYAEIKTERFKDYLELAYTYYQISETEKENLFGIMKQYKEKFYEIGDFACWRNFLEALEKQIQEISDRRKKVLMARLNAKLENDSSSKLLEKAKQLLENDRNFSVTEEYLNRYESGERDIDQNIQLENDYFNDFISADVFEPLYQECARCKGRAIKNFGLSYLEKTFPQEWTSRLRDNSKNLVSNWPVRKDTATPFQIQDLFKGLGISVIKATKINGRKEEMWQLTVKATEKSLADYLHPIAAFGTQMKSPLNVIFLYGSYTPQQLVDTVTSLNLGGISLVMIDRPMSATERRHMGEIFHTQKSGQNPFLLIDQVLLLYLAMHQETERLPALLKCTLPYATYQPFVRDGGSTADEMFCGRTLELAAIIEPKGACVVYGGRQLGKTALLERAESRCSKPENKEFAVYTTIVRHKTETEVVETLITDIKRKTNEKIVIEPCSTLRDMCAHLSDMFRRSQIESMHLLIDEVDDFLEAIASDAYKQIQPLVDLRRETKNKFKFVIAGLHNVCRAQNATKDNGIFGQLGTPLCIKPLSPTDAIQLLSKPLRYLGFQIDRYPHLETILTNTNYYPGILQFFGYILVETLTGQYSRYYHAADGNPPFTLQDEQLGAVMNSTDLNKSIKDKFRWSLELDQRYFMIARCITMLYHIHEENRASGSWRGFSVDDITDMALMFEIHCLENVSRSEYIVLLDEMVEMGILSKPSERDNMYRLRRNSFVDIIGEDMDVLEADIINNNTEE